MALADYYARGALAAAQILNDFDEVRFRARLEETPVGIAFDEKASGAAEGEALLDLLVRLLARLYPRLTLIGPGKTVRHLAELAKAINPVVELADDAQVGVAVGGSPDTFETTCFAGARGWDALISARRPQPIGDSANPFGAGAAACLAAANVFRRVFLPDSAVQVDESVRLSLMAMDRVAQPTPARRDTWRLRDSAVLAGVGAVGNAALWALARARLEGMLHLVDPQKIELSNIQRYVVASRSDDGRAKVDVGVGVPTNGLTLVPQEMTLEAFLSSHGYVWDAFLIGLDTAGDRRAAQAALPRWIANAWTQPRDLGVSIHPAFGDDGACVACLYLPDNRLPNEDELVTQALSVPDRQMEVRTLLYSGAPVPRAFLEAVANAIGHPIEALLPFEGRSIRDLYVEGFCGGAVIPLGEAGLPPEDLHVPLAHQSALAGVVLAAGLVRSALGADPPITSATRLNILQSVGTDLSQPVRARRDGRCLCDDPVYASRYRAKWA